MSSAHQGYYLPNPSGWPIVGSIGIFTTLLGFVMYLHDGRLGPWFMMAGAAVITVMLFGWFGKVIGESEGGLYNEQVDGSFRMAMMWFIFSEVMFFAGFFGALFYVRSLSIPWLSENETLWPGFEASWPSAGPQGPMAIAPDTHAGAGQFSTIGAWGIPFLNTFLLLTSSVTVTIAHWALKENKRGKLIFWLALSVILGAAFLYFQATEYHHAYTELGLTLGTGVYGATFFMLTGFHGLHVTIGAIILFVVLLRAIRGHFTAENHFAFEAGAWYWHFVDTVWVCLFVFVYVL
jgi:cytochrome c oxidase subunit 3